MNSLTLIGSFDCKLDSKGRLSIPVQLKKQLSGIIHEGFVIKKSVFQPCLEVYTMKEWNQITEKINRLNRFVKKNNDFIRIFYAGVKLVDVDGNGRLQIPKDLLDFAELDKEVVVSAAVNNIEIWDKVKYEQSIELDENDFAKLAEEVMGGMEDELS